MTMTKEPEDKLAHAKEQGQAQFDSIVEMVTELNAANTARAVACGRDAEQRWEIAEQAIQEDALSVEVRSDWHSPGPPTPHWDTYEAAEYRILLCTGGPAVRIRGDLRHCEPETAHLEVQDWGTPWTEFRPTYPKDNSANAIEEILLTYARSFWFGE